MKKNKNWLSCIRNKKLTVDETLFIQKLSFLNTNATIFQVFLHNFVHITKNYC